MSEENIIVKFYRDCGSYEHILFNFHSSTEGYHTPSREPLQTYKQAFISLILSDLNTHNQNNIIIKKASGFGF